VLNTIRNGYGMRIRNNIALSGLLNHNVTRTQGSASLHPGLRVQRGSATKCSQNVSVAMVRDFAHVIEREKAAMGFFVIAEPTAPMSKEAVTFGYYDQERFGPEYPKLQILTIEALMDGSARPRYPDLSLGRATFKKAQVEDVSGEQGRLL
jgi:hypothetical protein